MNNIESFVTETNRIEGILRPPTAAEIAEMERFIWLEAVSVAELQKFVAVYQPNAVIRDRVGLDVRVGAHLPPRGGAHILAELETLVGAANRRALSAFAVHQLYETLHPFTDCNGRSGRMLWAWQVGYEHALALGFLHRWYYASLDEARVPR